MLDLHSRVSLPSLRDVSVCRDDERPLAFYAWPAHPRVTRDGSGRYEMRLVVYGTRDDARFVPNGGMLALTMGLELSASEQSMIHAALTELITAGSKADPPPQPELLPPEWIDGMAELRLDPGGRIAGKPSLYAGNRCVFNVTIGAGEIAAFLDAWDHRLERAAVAFAMTVRARSGAAPLAFTGRVMPEDATPDDYVSRVEL